MERKHSFFLMMGALVFAVLVIFYVVSLRLQLQEVRANQRNYEEQIESLSNVQETEALEINRDFLNKYFTYNNTKERYENIKPLMTDRGYTGTYPSVDELPKSVETVSSSMSGAKSFRNQNTKTEIEFFNEFTLTTEFNDIGNTETVYVKTKLIYVKEQGWKVDEVKFIGQLTE